MLGEKQASGNAPGTGLQSNSGEEKIKISKKIHGGGDGSQLVLGTNVYPKQTTYIAAHARPITVGPPCLLDKRKPYFTPKKEC